MERRDSVVPPKVERPEVMTMVDQKLVTNMRLSHSDAQKIFGGAFSLNPDYGYVNARSHRLQQYEQESGKNKVILKFQDAWKSDWNDPVQVPYPDDKPKNHVAFKKVEPFDAMKVLAPDMNRPNSPDNISLPGSINDQISPYDADQLDLIWLNLVNSRQDLVKDKSSQSLMNPHHNSVPATPELSPYSQVSTPSPSIKSDATD